MTKLDNYPLNLDEILHTLRGDRNKFFGIVDYCYIGISDGSFIAQTLHIKVKTEVFNFGFLLLCRGWILIGIT